MLDTCLLDHQRTYCMHIHDDNKFTFIKIGVSLYMGRPDRWKAVYSYCQWTMSVLRILTELKPFNRPTLCISLAGYFLYMRYRLHRSYLNGVWLCVYTSHVTTITTSFTRKWLPVGKWPSVIYSPITKVPWDLKKVKKNLNNIHVTNLLIKRRKTTIQTLINIYL